MIVLDTDTLTFFFRNHPRVLARMQQANDAVAITIISRIEILRGRFDSVLKAADGAELQRGQQRLAEAEDHLGRIPKVLGIDADAAEVFNHLRGNKKLKKIGRADLLIASIVLANRATLITRNLKDFRQVPGLQIDNWVD
jgi:tRNA(fMet)-specific endonuclease VapC